MGKFNSLFIEYFDLLFIRYVIIKKMKKTLFEGRILGDYEFEK